MRQSPLLSLFASVLVIISAGFPLTFSLYAPSFQLVLRYSQFEINCINVANIVGQFLAYPLIGSLSDKYGANRVSLFSGILGVPALLLAANAYQERKEYVALAATFFMIGVASTCAYITSVSSCARSFANARGLAIAIPVCAYGFATLLYTIVFERYFATMAKGHIQYDIPGFWRSLSWFSGLAAILGFLCMAGKSDKAHEPKTSDADQIDDEVDEGSSLLPQDSAAQPPFFKDITVLLYAVAYVFVAGATETLVGNMGSIVESIALTSPDADGDVGSYASRAVSVFAIFSTLSRLLVGILGDALAKRGRSRVTILIGLVALMAFAMLLLALGPPSTTLFFLIAGINGLCYGSLYCIGPVLASVIWGLEKFGRNWGCLAYSPLVGSVMGSLLYATVYDTEARRQHAGNEGNGLVCAGSACYSISFFTMGSAVILAGLIWLAAWRIWRIQGIAV